MNNEKKIFISHSSDDSIIVEKIIDLLEVIGVPSEKIFCTSFEGYSIRLGQDFLQTIKEELNKDVLVLFILSESFYKSPISLCEMGATWVKTNEHIPILIPPFDYTDIKGVIPNTQGMRINEKAKLNSFKENIEQFLSINPQSFSTWERKRDNSLEAINTILEKRSAQDKTTSSSDAIFINAKKEVQSSKSDKTITEEVDQIIKSKAQLEWPNDFEMQLYNIEKQRAAYIELGLYKPIDIPKDQMERIRSLATDEWPDDFEMRLYTEQKQVESYRKLRDL